MQLIKLTDQREELVTYCTPTPLGINIGAYFSTATGKVINLIDMSYVAVLKRLSNTIEAI